MNADEISSAVYDALVAGLEQAHEAALHVERLSINIERVVITCPGASTPLDQAPTGAGG
jgi:hypothetical protein